MHFTDTVYRNPYWPTFPLLQITQDWIDLCAMVKEKFGGLDVLVNNAGIECGKDIKDEGIINSDQAINNITSIKTCKEVVDELNIFA